MSRSMRHVSAARSRRWSHSESLPCRTRSGSGASRILRPARTPERAQVCGPMWHVNDMPIREDAVAWNTSAHDFSWEDETIWSDANRTYDVRVRTDDDVRLQDRTGLGRFVPVRERVIEAVGDPSQMHHVIANCCSVGAIPCNHAVSAYLDLFMNARAVKQARVAPDPRFRTNSG